MNSKELWKMSVEFNDNELEKIIPYQVTDETSSDCGGLYDDSLGFCGATHYETMKLLRNLGYAYCTKESKYFEDEEILKRIELCMQFQKSRQRKSGLIDLRTRNYDSPPDTAFAMNIPAVIIYMARNTKEMKTAEKLEQILMPYVKSSALAMKNDGGFHTPNHRWIISGALAIAQELYPELELTEAIYSYLNETIDLNEDGLYSEKSFLYSAYINDKLMNVYHTYHDEKILNAIYKNCLCMIELMNNDYTLLTSISIRQDKGKKIYPTQFLNCFYFVAKKFNDMQLWNALDSVVKTVGIESPELLYLFKRYPEWINDEVETENYKENGIKCFKQSGIYSYRKDDFSVWIMENSLNIISIKFGDITLSSVKLNSPYYSCAKFYSRQIETKENGFKIKLIPTYGGGQEYYMPGFWLPLNRPVGYADLPYNNLKERQGSPRPKLEYEWDITIHDYEVEIKMKSIGGLDNIPVAMEFFFDLPGILNTECSREIISQEKNIFLTKGKARFRNGYYALEIGDGNYMHDCISSAAKGKLNVAITERLPIDKVYTIKAINLSGKSSEEYRNIIK